MPFCRSVASRGSPVRRSSWIAVALLALVACSQAPASSPAQAPVTSDPTTTEAQPPAQQATEPSVCGSSEPAPAPVATEPPSSGRAYEFVDVSQSSGITAEHCRSWGTTWVDHELDGDPDLVLNRHYFRPFAYANVDASYQAAAWQDTLREPGFDRHVCLWGDPSRDGRPDLLCTQGAERGKGTGPNQLLVQNADGSFTDRASSFGVEYSEGRTRLANWVDYDGDNDLDLFLGVQRRSGFPNRMYRNDGQRFERVRVGLEHELQTEASAWSDWDRDGDVDLLLTLKAARSVAYENRNGRFRRVRVPRVTTSDWLGASFGNFDRDRWPDLLLVNERRSVVLQNRRGRFVPVHKLDTVQGRMGVWFDADNDTDQDIFLVRGAPGKGDDPDATDLPDLLLIREGTGFSRRGIRSSGVATGNGDSAAVADHDRDGTLDLFVTNGYKRSHGPFVLLENRSRVGKSAAVRLDGGRSDPFGMWARLRVSAGNRVYWRQTSDGLVFRSQSEIGYTHLGLGGADRARVRVIWRDGATDCVGIKAGDVVDVEKKSSPCN